MPGAAQPRFRGWRIMHFFHVIIVTSPQGDYLCRRTNNINIMTTQSLLSDRVRGSLVGGAAGDALGYAVEFRRWREIERIYGPAGIRKFALHSDGLAHISDDTQMTLFTANGLLNTIVRNAAEGKNDPPETLVPEAYHDWYETQTHAGTSYSPHTWLRNLPELQHRRGPGSTCMTALSGYTDNDSCGCGGIMRVAPVGLLAATDAKPYATDDALCAAAAYTSWCTHKHPMGYLPSAAMALLLSRLVTMPREEVLENLADLILQAAKDAVETVDSWSFLAETLADSGKYERIHRHATTLINSTIEAIYQAQHAATDHDGMKLLGEGWVAQETWYIAVFSSVRHLYDPAQAIITAVNHNGDSDSTGAVTGNLIGAIYGYDYLRDLNLFCPSDHTLETTLELTAILLAIADDLSTCDTITPLHYDRYVHHSACL